MICRFFWIPAFAAMASWLRRTFERLVINLARVFNSVFAIYFPYELW